MVARTRVGADVVYRRWTAGIGSTWRGPEGGLHVWVGTGKIMGMWAKVKRVKDSVTDMAPSVMVDRSRVRTDLQATELEPEPSEIYASELLDEKTCRKCAEMDGHDYDSMADAKADYPMGGYKHCESESGCRGTLVMTYKGLV